MSEQKVTWCWKCGESLTADNYCSDSECSESKQQETEQAENIVICTDCAHCEKVKDIATWHECRAPVPDYVLNSSINTAISHPDMGRSCPCFREAPQ